MLPNTLPEVVVIARLQVKCDQYIPSPHTPQTYPKSQEYTNHTNHTARDRHAITSILL